VLQIWILHNKPELVPIDEQADDNVVHSFKFREANGFAREPFNPCSQREARIPHHSATHSTGIRPVIP
jgi:hypothetical protein